MGTGRLPNDDDTPAGQCLFQGHGPNKRIFAF